MKGKKLNCEKFCFFQEVPSTGLSTTWQHPSATKRVRALTPDPVKSTGFAVVTVNVQTNFLTIWIQLTEKLVVQVSFSCPCFSYTTKQLNCFFFLPHTAAKSELIKSKLPNSVLSKIWKLSDVDCDGFLDIEEFALAMHLINVKVEGNELPNVLPDHLVPPTKR